MKLPGELVVALRTSFPRASIEEEVLGSGAVWINIRLETAFVTIECSPRRGFGVSLVPDGDPGLGGHDRVFNDASEVLTYVQQLLQGKSRMGVT